MKHLLLCILLLPAFLGAQCYGSFEVFGGAGFSNVPVKLTQVRSIITDPTLVTRFGFGASFRVGQRTYLRTSVQFSQYGGQRSFSQLRWGTQHDGNGGFDPNAPAPADAPGSIFSREKHLFVEGALAFRYQFKTRSNWQPFVEGGAAVGKYGTTATFTRTVSLDGSTTETKSAQVEDNFRSVALIGRVGAGANYNFSERVGVYGMAVFQRHLQNLNTVGPARVHPWQATLEAGVRVFVDPR